MQKFVDFVKAIILDMCAVNPEKRLSLGQVEARIREGNLTALVRREDVLTDLKGPRAT